MYGVVLVRLQQQHPGSIDKIDDGEEEGGVLSVHSITIYTFRIQQNMRDETRSKR